MTGRPRAGQHVCRVGERGQGEGQGQAQTLGAHQRGGLKIHFPKQTPGRRAQRRSFCRTSGRERVVPGQDAFLDGRGEGGRWGPGHFLSPPFCSLYSCYCHRNIEAQRG